MALRLSPQQTLMMQVLGDGEPHTAVEVKEVIDPLMSPPAWTAAVGRLRNKLIVEGYLVVCRPPMYGRPSTYQVVQKISGIE